MWHFQYTSLFFSSLFRMWNVKLTNPCWGISRKWRSSSWKMYVWSCYPITGRSGGLISLKTDLWEQGVNWGDSPIIWGGNLQNYLLLFNYMEIVPQANVKCVLCCLKVKKKNQNPTQPTLFGMRGTTEKGEVLCVLPTWAFLEAQLSSHLDFPFIYEENIFSSSMLIACFPSIDSADLIRYDNQQLMMMST